MQDEQNKPDEPANQDQPHRRRKRYGGTHPKRFEQKYKEHDPHAYPQLHDKLRAKGKTPAGTHVPVLRREVMALLRPLAGEVVADCTLGYGGHAAEFLRRIAPGGRVVGFDVDGDQIERTRQRLEELCAQIGMMDTAKSQAMTADPAKSQAMTDPAVGGKSRLLSIHRANFAGIGNYLAQEGLEGYDIIFADLGVSSMQVDDPSRGISYRAEGPLDMRMDSRLQRTGADLLATLDEKELSTALWELSDEEDHAKLAQWIVAQRQVAPIETTGQLVRLILNAKGYSPRSRHKPDWEVPGGLHPAAKTFQALRILVNDELGSLRALLRTAPYILRPGGRLGIISFHSGEDRLVKRSFRELQEQGVYESISDEVIRPGQSEVNSNPRSSSAKFRWARKGR